MKVLASVMALVLLATGAQAQGTTSLTTQMNGSPLKLGSKSNVEGSPYFKPNFCTATLVTNDGQMYAGVSIKLNLQNNQVSFIRDGVEEQQYTPAFQVKEVYFSSCAEKGKLAMFRLGYPATGIQDENTYYQVLDTGKVALLKYIQVVETAKPVNGFTAGDGTTVLQKVESYYLYSPKLGIVKVGKSNSDVLKALQDKKSDLENFLSTNNMKVKKEDDLVSLIKYYNTL